MARQRFVEVVGAIGAAGLASGNSGPHTLAAPLTYANGLTVPDLAAGDHFMMSVLSSGGLTLEVIKVTGYTASTGIIGTMVRGREKTTALTHAAGLKVVCSVVPSDIGSSWEDAISDLSTGLVHRWKFDETSGATIADSVGSLNLTLSGTVTTNYVRNVTGPPGLGKATTLVASGSTADSAGLGSLPVGSTDRTLVFVFRTTSQTRQVLLSYGVNNTRTFFFADLNSDGASTAIPTGALSAAGGGSVDLTTLVSIPIADGEWHMAAIGMRGGNGKNRFVYLDKIHAAASWSTANNTTASGNFSLGFGSGIGFTGDLADLPVWNRGLSRFELDHLANAFAGGFL